jgi:WD40 repeat protein
MGKISGGVSILTLRILILLLSLMLCPLPAQALWGPDKTVGKEGQLSAHKHEIFSTAFSPDGSLLATGSFDGSTRIWDTETWTVLHELAGHGNWVSAVAFSPNGKYLVSAGIDRRIQIWDPLTGDNLYTSQEHSKGVLCLAFSPDGKYLASGSLDGKILLYNLKDWHVEKILTPSKTPSGIGALAFSPDGLWLASSSYDDPVIRLWNPDSGQMGPILSDHIKEIYALAFSPNGKYLASAGEDRIIRLWDTTKRVVISRLAGHYDSVWSLAFNPEGDFLASGSMGDGTIRFWTVPQGVNTQALSDIPAKTYSLSFHPSQSLLASGHSDPLLRIWKNTHPDAVPAFGSLSGKEIATWLQPDLKITGLSIDDDRSGLSSGNNNHMPEAGELVEIELQLQNKGNAPAFQVQAEIALSPNTLNYQGDALNFNLENWPMGAVQTLVLPVFIPKNTSSQTIKLELKLKMASSRQIWQESIEIELGKAYPTRTNAAAETSPKQ